MDNPLPITPVPLAAVPDDATVIAKASSSPLVVEEEPPWWLQYRPPAHPTVADAIAVDCEAEYAAGLRFSDISDRLRRNGVAEAALKTVVSLLQDPDVSDKVRLDAAKTVLGLSYGTPATMRVEMDVRPSVIVNL
jgi:hypothetical protein